MTIPDSVVTIEKYAFYVCNNLTTITIPTSVNYIGSGVFSGTALKSVYVEKGSYAENWAEKCGFNPRYYK